MAKITLDTITSSFASTSLFNTNFSDIATELNDKVLYRNNPAGEANQMENDLDMNNNDVLNAGTVNTTGLILNGTSVTATGVSSLPATGITYDNTTSGLTATDLQAAVDEVEARVDTAETNISTNTTNITANDTQLARGNNHGKNLIINGDFSVWQRGTSFTGTEYTADRFKIEVNGSTHTSTQQTHTVGQTDVSGNPRYFYRTVVSSVAGASNYVFNSARLEDVRKYSGQEVTLSFWAKADSAKDIATEFEQNFGTGGSPSATVNTLGVTTHSLTTSWQRFTVTTTLPSISGKTLGTTENNYLRIFFWLDAGSSLDARTNTLGQQSGTFDISNVQLELGDTATDFEYVSPADQLARCQRYTYVPDFENVNLFATFGRGSAISTTVANIEIDLPTSMRSVPSVTVTNVANMRLSDGVAGAALTNLAALANQSSTKKFMAQATVSSGLTQYRPYTLDRNNSFAPVVVISAEL